MKVFPNIILIACLIPESLSFFFTNTQIQAFSSNKLAINVNKDDLCSNQPNDCFHFHPIHPRSSLSFLSQSSTSTLDQSMPTDSLQQNEKNFIGDVVILLPSKDADTIPSKFGSCSPVPNPSLQDAANHLAKKIHYFSDGTVQVNVLEIPESPFTTSSSDITASLWNTIRNANALIALNIGDSTDVVQLRRIFEERENLPSNQRDYSCHFALDTTPSNDLSNLVGPYVNNSNPFSSIIADVSPWTTYASAQRLEAQMMGLFDRWTSDDFTIALMLFFNLFNTNKRDLDASNSNNQNSDGEKSINQNIPTTIPWVEHSIDATWEKGPLQNAQEFYSMISKCGSCITECLADENCKACIDALNAVDTRDQVASYRTVVSYESDLLREFSFCILQKNNIFGCKATIPEIPVVAPLEFWRGNKLTQDDAKGILVAHLDDEDAPEGGGGTEVSWKVACGANVAYDQFPSQNQLFYTSVNGRGLWYDPVFRVETIDGRNVWAKRHYRVRYGKVPGTFYFSVLDNGVTSNEFWTIVGAADDLSWVVFHYAGAAGAVGQRYLGGLLCTADGALPPPEQLEEIWPILQSCGIEPWELFVVDNDLESAGALEAGNPPLDFFRKDVLKAKEELKAGLN